MSHTGFCPIIRFSPPAPLDRAAQIWVTWASSPRAEKAAAMAELLRSRTALPVILWDERRTTIDAHQILMAGGKNAKKRKKVVDAVAASLILEGYLTYKKSHPEG